MSMLFAVRAFVRLLRYSFGVTALFLFKELGYFIANNKKIGADRREPCDDQLDSHAAKTRI